MKEAPLPASQETGDETIPVANSESSDPTLPTNQPQPSSEDVVGDAQSGTSEAEGSTVEDPLIAALTEVALKRKAEQSLADSAGAEQPSESGIPVEDDSEDTPSSGTGPDAEDQAQTPTDAVQPNRKNVGLVGKVLNSWRTVGACAASLTLGFVASSLISGGRAEPIVEAEETVEQPRFVAAVARRNEAISPLVPFDDLDDDVIALGKKLFHDPGLSGDGRISCASCHEIASGGDDGRSLAEGFEHSVGDRNTPTVLNVGYNFVQFWDGRAETLEEQVDGPLLNPNEMNSDWARILKYLKSNDRYVKSFEDHLGGEPSEDRVRAALATYERSLVTPNSVFDSWLAGDEEALGGDEYAGYYLFKKMNCLGCHNGPGVGGNSFERLGRFRAYFTKQNPGRESDLGRFLVTGDERDRYVFRVPPLRNIALTAPYLHDGSVDSLEKTVELMIKHQVGMEATPEAVRRIVAFLKTLTGELPQ